MEQPTHRVHWWRYTTKERDPEAVAADITSVVGGEFGSTEKRGAYNQPFRMKHTTGGAIYFGSKEERQPIVVDFNGEACDQLRALDLSMMASNSDGAVSRVDVACDLGPVEQARKRLREMRRVFTAGRCSTRIPATSVDYYASKRPGDGETLYVGSKSSEAYLRAYDRRGPLRIEWEWKPQNADVRSAIPAALARHGPAAMWRSLAQRCRWPMEWCQNLYRGSTIDIEAPPERIADLAETMNAIRAQYGEAIYVAMNLCGVPISEIAVPADNPTREQMQRRRRWAEQAEAAGYNRAKKDGKHAGNETDDVDAA